MPSAELTGPREQRLEARVCAWLLKVRADSLVRAWEVILDKTNGQDTADVQLALVGHGDIQASIFDVFSGFLVHSLAAPMNLSGESADVCLGVDRGGLARTHPFVGREQFIQVGGYALHAR
jgi:hypothetical protein